MIDEVRPLDGASDLVQELARRGLTIVLATSGKPPQTERFIDLLGIRQLLAGWTSSEDVGQTKPEPDLVGAAMRKGGGRTGVLLGDSTWDMEAAGRAGMRGVGLRTGGFSVDDLISAGAAEVYDSLRDVLADLDEAPLLR